MTAARAFLLYNLGAGVLAGLLAWAVVALGVKLLRIEDGKLRLCLFTAPLIKSTMVVLGLSGVVLWRVPPFEGWHAAALDPERVVPWFLLATGVLIVARSLESQRLARALVKGAHKAVAVEPRFDASLTRVLTRLGERRQMSVTCEGAMARPDVLVSDRVGCPTALLGPPRAILFPRGWATDLSDAALDGAMAHELAHLRVRRPLGCLSSELVRSFTALNPFAALVSRQLEFEEEKACDDFAVEVVADRAVYASMLVTAYRFATGRDDRWTPLRWAAQLVGRRAAISARVERVLAPEGAGESAQLASFVLLWCVLALAFFSG